MVGYITGSLTRKLGAMLILMILLIAVIVGAVLVTLSQQAADAGVLNIAGRQRMLSQRMAKEALAVKSSNAEVTDVAGRQRMLSQRMAKNALMLSQGDAGAGEALAASHDLFDTSLDDLINGNAELGMPVATASALPALQHVQSLWVPFSEAVQTILTADAGSNDINTALAYITSHNNELLTASNDAVLAFAHDESASDRLGEAADLFDRSLNGLANGDAELDLPEGSVETRALLSEVSTLWAVFSASVDIVREGTPGVELDMAVAEILHDSNELLTMSNAAVLHLQEETEAKTTQLQTIIWIMAAVSVW